MSAIQGGGNGTQPMSHTSETTPQAATAQTQEESTTSTPRATVPSAFSGDVCLCNPAVLHAILANAGSQMEAWNSMNKLASQNTPKPQGYQAPSESETTTETHQHSAPSAGGTTATSTAGEPEAWPLTSNFSMPGDTTDTSGWQPPQDINGFLAWADAGEKATSLELMTAARDMSPDEQLFARLALNYQTQMTDGKTFSADSVTQDEYNTLLAVYQAVHSAPEKRLAMTQEGDENNFGFMLNMMDMFGDEFALYDNFNTSVAGGDRNATRMSSFETLAAAGAEGDKSVITVEDLITIVHSEGYSAADKAFAQRLLDDPDLMAKLARYDTGGEQVIDKAGLMAMAQNYHAEMSDKDSGMFKASALINYSNSSTDVMDRTFVTWQVDEEKQEIHLDNGWKIKVYNEKSSWDLIDPEGNVAHVWGDPHIDLRAGGETDGNTRDFDIAHDWTFQAGGAKISVGTVGNNKWKYSDTLTITSEGGQSIEVKGIHSGNVEFVTQENGQLVGTNGAAVDAKKADGEWVVSGGTALDWFHDVNRDGALSEDEKENRKMNENKYDERNGFWDKNRNIT